MVSHRRPPRVKDGGNAEAGAEVLWIGRGGGHRLRRSMEQQAVDRRVVPERDVDDLGWQREDDGGGRPAAIGLALGEPVARGRALTIGTMPVLAGIARAPPMAAAGAGIDMTVRDGCAAGPYR
jgi:hypothetical protein